MRTREQFKAYVYEKAEAEMQRKKRSRNVWIRSIATCSLLLIVGGVMLYSGIGVNDKTMDAAPEARMEKGEAENVNGCYYSFDAADGDMAETAAPFEIAVDDYNYLYSASLTAEEAATVSGVTLDSFDFAKVEAQYGGPDEGVRGSGFKNIFKVSEEDFDLLALAKNECTVEYDSYDVAYDEDSEIWRVTFYMADTVGGDQTVYIGTDGKTRLIVYGE